MNKPYDGGFDKLETGFIYWRDIHGNIVKVNPNDLTTVILSCNTDPDYPVTKQQARRIVKAIIAEFETE